MRRPAARVMLRASEIARVRACVNSERTFKPTLHFVLRRRSAMRQAIRAVLTRVGQGRHIAPIGLDAPTAVTVHRSVIRIGHDDVVPDVLKVLGDPFTLRRGLHAGCACAAAPKRHG